MNHVQRNINRFYSKLNELRKEEKYTDITLQCESKRFKCHRLVLTVASPYFEAMFESNFKENTMECIDLKEVSAATFEEVLQFIYTGNVDVNAANVFDLLQVSDYYNLPGIEDICFKFISSTHLLTTRTVFSLLSYACDAKKNNFISILSKRIAEHFSVCCKLREFLEISFDSFQIILSHYLSLSSKNEESLLTAVIQWTCYKREERSRYIDKFLGIIQIENISPAYYRLMTKTFIAERDRNRDVFPTPVSRNMASESEKDSILKIENGLHIYVRCKEENSVRIFTVNSINECNNSGKILLTHLEASIRCVASDDLYLYCLEYIKRIPDKQNSKNQIFFAYTAVDKFVTTTLTSPPLLFRNVSLCYLQNNIYAYDERVRCYDLVRTNSKSCEMFNDEEISRGIFVYNCSSDNWFSVPQMKQVVVDACMTVCESTLYLVGGSGTPNQLASVGYMQAFDFRAGWRLLPSSCNIYHRASCCSLNGKIYVCGGEKKPRSVERYDPIASKWETIQSMDNNAIFHRMVPFDNKLWVMGSYDLYENRYSASSDLSLNVYDIAVNQWSKSLILTEAAAASIQKPATILEGVVYSIL